MREYRDFSYDGEGRLVAAGEHAFGWTTKGSLKSLKDTKETTTYSYGKDTRLDRIVLPDGTRIEYRYGEGLIPVSFQPVFCAFYCILW